MKTSAQNTGKIVPANNRRGLLPGGPKTRLPITPLAFLRAAALGGVLLVAGGCQKSGTDTADLDIDFSQESDVAKEMRGNLGSAATDFATDTPLAPALEEQQLQLRVQPGHKFPLLKTVEQRVMQGTPGKLVGRSLLELQMSITVEEAQQSLKRLAVSYHRVRFHQEIGGKVIDYESGRGGEVPPEALAYAGLVDNGFSFWLDSTNHVQRVLGYEKFIEQCLANVPEVRKQAVIAQLAVLPHDEGVMNFIDDSIGLLPAQGSAPVHVGSSWNLPKKRTDGPIPMTVETRCMVKELTEKDAIIDVVGTVAPSAAQYGSTGVKVAIRNGRRSGLCTVDLATGVPTNSRLSSTLDMMVYPPEGPAISQFKETIVTIQSFLDQGSAPTGNATGPAVTGGEPRNSPNATSPNRWDSPNGTGPALAPPGNITGAGFSEGSPKGSGVTQAGFETRGGSSIQQASFAEPAGKDSFAWADAPASPSAGFSPSAGPSSQPGRFTPPPAMTAAVDRMPGGGSLPGPVSESFPRTAHAEGTGRTERGIPVNPRGGGDAPIWQP